MRAKRRSVQRARCARPESESHRTETYNTRPRRGTNMNTGRIESPFANDSRMRIVKGGSHTYSPQELKHPIENVRRYAWSSLSASSPYIHPFHHNPPDLHLPLLTNPGTASRTAPPPIPKNTRAFERTHALREKRWCFFAVGIWGGRRMRCGRVGISVWNACSFVT